MNTGKHPQLDEVGECFPIFLLSGHRVDTAWARFEVKEPSQYMDLGAVGEV